MSPQADETESHYRVVLDDDKGCTKCGHGLFYTIVSGTVENEMGVGTSWGDKEVAEDICDLMNMAYGYGQESVQQTHGIATHREWITERAEWLKKERMNGGNWEYLKNKEEETRYCLEKFDAHVPALKETP